MKFLEIDHISKALDLFGANLLPPSQANRQAAVAAILRQDANGLEALFILRAIKEGDPWSGHMAFPGGHLELSDASLRHAAERETMEEIGLDLEKHADFLGQITEVRVQPRGRDIDMVVTPFVYLLNNPEPAMSLNYEVADVLWGSLNDMYSGENVTQLDFVLNSAAHDAGSQVFPGYQVGDQVVWGLTLKMLDDFFTIVNPNWTPKYGPKVD